MQTVSNAITPPPFWILDWKDNPQKIDEVIQALKFFEVHSDWAASQPDEAKKYFELLSHTYCGFSDLSEAAWKTYDMLLNRFPNLFPKCALLKPSIEQMQGLLQAGIEYKLKHLAWWGFRRLNNERHFVNLDVNEWTWSIYPSLQKAIFKKTPGHILMVSMDDLSLVPLFNSMMPITLTIRARLKRHEFEKVVKTCTEVEELNLYEYREFDLKKDVPLLKEMKNLKKFDCNHTFRSTVEVDQYLSLINPLEVTRLRIDSKDITDEWLLQLSQKLPHLKYLNISSAQITCIPFKELTTLDCFKCKALKEISLHFATHIHCYECDQLKKITAPEINKIYCIDCPLLEESDTPKAKIMKYSSCQSLKEIKALHAEKVTLHKCNAIETLSSLCAKYLYCTNCSKLKALCTPAAEMVDVSNCGSIQIISAPKAFQITCLQCPETNYILAKNECSIKISANMSHLIKQYPQYRFKYPKKEEPFDFKIFS